MTISYSAEVPNGSSFGVFWKILWKWRGSVYKLVWRELLAYLALYYCINLTYRYALNDDQKVIFQTIRQYFGQHNESIPMSFVLGFYVSLVVKRWWEQYRMLPWPDTLALFISAAIPGNEETGRLMRRNIMRYMVLAYVITLQRISLRVKRRFPTWQHVVDAGLMLESERKIFEMMDSKSPMSKYWMPLVWATNIINRARKEGLITSDHIVQTLLMELSDIRRRLGGLISYDTVCVPLVYTQVVTLVLHTYFAAALLGRHQDQELYFPLFTTLQFVFYVGWLKVAEVLINPFGEDDDDIELNWLIDRHIKASYMIVDEMHEEHPELLKDQYWEEVVPKDLPYTVASEHYRRHEPKGSAEQYKVKADDAVYANIVTRRQKSIVDAEGYADYESVDTPMAERRKSWFSRQITRMGSARSASTAYSSGGLFGRNRHNSVYSSPEAGVPPGSAQHVPGAQKMSLYDKFVGRKSMRAQRHMMKQNSKQSINGSINKSRARPRIPTPDVTKDVLNNERERNHLEVPKIQNTNNSVTGSVGIMSQQLATQPSIYPAMRGSDVPVVGTLLLTPIKEQDSTSVNSTLQAGHPATAALAKSILPATLKTAGIGTGNTALTSITLPMSSSKQQGEKNPFLVMPTSSNTIDTPVFVIPTTSTSPPPSYRTDDDHDKPLAITTMFSTPKSDLSEDMTTTVVTTFPIHKSSSYSELGKLEDKNKPNNSQSLDTENRKSVVDGLQLPAHSVSAPGSKTNTLTKTEVYV